MEIGADIVKTINPLIADIMDRKNHLGIGKSATILMFDQIGNSRRLPVVAMNNIWCKIQQGQGIQHGSTKKTEPFAVIVITIKRGALKKSFIVNKIKSNPLVFAG